MLEPPEFASETWVQPGRAWRNRPGLSGFTLVELLVVIAIIAILTSLLFAGLGTGREKSRRADCLNLERQFVMASHLYANDNDQRLPAPGTDNYNLEDTHTPILSTRSATNLMNYMTLASLDCPNLHPWMQRRGNWRNHLNYGIAVGYHFLGGHRGTPWDPPPGTTNRWISPQKTDADPALPLVADLNIYCYSFQRILAPHTLHGPIVREDNYFAANDGAINETPVNIGGQGGNVALLDGSAAWRPMRKMKPYRASHLWAADGSFGYW